MKEIYIVFCIIVISIVTLVVTLNNLRIQEFRSNCTQHANNKAGIETCVEYLKMDMPQAAYQAIQ